MTLHPTNVRADLFGDALLRDWVGPVLDSGMGGPQPRVVLRVYHSNVFLVGGPLSNGQPTWDQSAIERVSLDLTRPECRHRLCVVLAAGEKCPSSAHPAPSVPYDGRAYCICRGTGYLRQPAPAWHLLPTTEGGTLDGSLAAHSPALLAAHAQMVAIGKGLLGVLGNWRPADSMPERQFRPRWAPGCNNDNAYTICEPRGWRYGFCYEVGGPETGDAGKAKADAAAIEAGYALLESDGTLRLPGVTA